MKLKKIISILTMSIMMTSILMACNINKSYKENNSAHDNSLTNLTYEVTSTKNTTNEIQIEKFNLGTAIIEERNKKIPFDIEGILSVPLNLEDKAPVVLIFHGRHVSNGKTDFEDGFKYLVEDLSKNGIIGIAVDTGINYDFDHGEPVENERIIKLAQTHIDALKQADEGKDLGYGIDLKGKIDLNKIGLVGHSVAGSGVFKIASDQIQKENNGIQGILSVAPANNEVIEKFPDVKTSIIVSEYDGDVIHSGADIYESIKNDKNRKNPLGLTYLVGANHNAYNSILGDKEFSTPQTTNGSYPDKLSKEEQRDFLANYTVDYMKEIFEVENSVSPIFNHKETLPHKMYGYETLNRVNYYNSTILFSEQLFKDIVNKDVETQVVVESSIPDNDTAELFRTIEFKDKIDLLKINWEKKDASIDIPLKNNNLKEYSEVVFAWALNSPSELNSLDKPVSFYVTMVDGNGQESSVKIDGDKVSAMKYFNGEVIEDEYLEGKFMRYWSRYTPITETTIPLDKFSDIDLSNIQSIKLNFKESEKGSIYIKEISGIKK